eukprot:GHVN01013740.1.p1 GENE.GHVN01013740.1~~GHVN01013740.1.p1  ORF type:complete len:1361 (-),score=207.02 GHVN01013740.1:83-4165(-)
MMDKRTTSKPYPGGMARSGLPLRATRNNTGYSQGARSAFHGLGGGNDGLQRDGGLSSIRVDPDEVGAEGRPLLQDQGFSQNKLLQCVIAIVRGLGSCLCYCFRPASPSKLERQIHIQRCTKNQVIPSRCTRVPNAVKNQKYNIITFLPLVMYQQFRFFFNLFYLAVALAQLVPFLKVGPLFTYLAPLGMVLFVTISKEAIDDIKRLRRDREVNGQIYNRVTPLVSDGSQPRMLIGPDSMIGDVRRQPGYEVARVTAGQIRVGDVIQICANQRVPADCVFLRTLDDASGSAFLRTDQMDGETDWKLRRAVAITQQVRDVSDIFDIEGVCHAEPPRRDIYEFVGKFCASASACQKPHVMGIAHSGVDEGSFSSSSKNRVNPLAPPKPIGKQVRSPKLGDSPPSETGFDSPSSLTADLLDFYGSGACDRKAGGERLLHSGKGRGNLATDDDGDQGRNTKHDDFLMESLSLDSTLWANTVVAGGTLLALAVYTGRETRFALNTSSSRGKMGKLDLEVNTLSKVLFVLLVALSAVLVGLRGLQGAWLFIFMRFILLLASIIPISLRVNLDMAKTYYSHQIMRDKKIKNTVVRASNLPEELGRIDHLMCDKTGTLTKNDMVLKRLHVGRACFACNESGPPPSNDQGAGGVFSGSQGDVGSVDFAGGGDARGVSFRNWGGANQGPSRLISSSSSSRAGVPTASVGGTDGGGGIDTIRLALNSSFADRRRPPGIPSAESASCLSPSVDIDGDHSQPAVLSTSGATDSNTPSVSSRRVELRSAVRQAVTALAVCHNVTPVKDANTKEVSFQAASPDEVALVKFASSVGLRLASRDDRQIQLVGPMGVILTYNVLQVFPFSSETKRMGIIVKDSFSSEIMFYMKGAESVMLSRGCLAPRSSHWLPEECDNLGREGLRTLVVAGRALSEEEYKLFASRMHEARVAMKDRERQTRSLVDELATQMEVLALTGVEDRLQQDVAATIESLRHGGVRVWMLTGDKIETAICIAISAGLKGRHQGLMVLSSQEITTPSQCAASLQRFGMGPSNTVLVVDGGVLAICLKHHPLQFVDVACRSPSVICCRCSPTQKAQVVKLIREETGQRCCAIGDGGNDVSMLLAADVGVGIVGKEGLQASLAADFSVLQFSFLKRLLLWHGRNSYQRSANLAQFVIHRGLIIAIIQVIFSAMFFFIPLALFQGWLTVGYATYYTMAPVFSLVLDVELPEEVVFIYPELYAGLKQGRAMGVKTFFGWVWMSTYQGGVIMMGAIALFEDSFTNIVAITFTSLILAELLNCASQITTWHPLMIAAQIVSVIIYVFSMFILRNYFDIMFIMTTTFCWKVTLITLISWLPVHVFKVVRKMVQPPQHTKLAV